MKQTILFTFILIALSTAAAASIERGQYVVRNVAVCGSCHAEDPRNPDGPLSGGMEFHDWRIGTARAANLTPDVETGLGSWSEIEIVRAIRTGERKGGRLLAPVMPYEWLHDMSDDDALSVAQYLKSLQPVHNAVRQSPNLAFKMGKIFLRPKSGPSPAAPAPAATAEYGGYLSQHVGLCAECHTPRGGLMAKADKSRLFAGVPHPPKDFPSNPLNITPDNATGIGQWTEADFLRTMRTGIEPKGGPPLHPFMPWRENARMTDDDLRAIFRFLRTVPPIRNQVERRPATRSGSSPP